MGIKGIRKILPHLGWIIAALVVVMYVGSKFDISISQKQENGTESEIVKQAQKSTPVVPAKALKRSAPPTPPKPRTLSTEELFQVASPSVVLIEVFDDEGQKIGTGSGFVASSNGTIITNYHVIRGADRAIARFNDGSSAPITGVAGYDPNRDVAALRTDGPVPKPLSLGNSENVKTGQKVIAIGSPLGFQNTVSEGIVSGLRSGLVQMSTPISPGSSGGPLLNAYGKVVGVAVASATQGQNLNFAVPVNWAKAYTESKSTRSLAEITRENTVTERILDGSVKVTAGETQGWTFMVDNSMGKPEVICSLKSEGGLTGNIEVWLLSDGKELYKTGRVKSTEFRRRLASGHSYTLMLDNRGSEIFVRTVTGKILFRYVK